ncbi:unnamed protein product, partial [Ixodes pacificus]
AVVGLSRRRSIWIRSTAKKETNSETYKASPSSPIEDILCCLHEFQASPNAKFSARQAWSNETAARIFSRVDVIT